MIGEVWLASGQSNMEMDFDYCCNTTDNSEIELSSANYPEIRMLNITNQISSLPTNNFEGNWEKAVGKNIVDFSAVGYFFAKKLHKKLNIPIGIINSSWGGTDIEAWTSRETLDTIDFLKEDMSSYDTLVNKSSKSIEWFSQFESVKLPSDVWYLFLEDPIGMPDKWKKLDFKDDKYISSSYQDYTKWEKLILPGSFDNVFETNDFDGAILFEKSFSLKEVKGNYTLNLGPIIDMEFTYINGEKIGSSLGKKSLANKSYKIPKNLLKTGQNSIIIKVINQYNEGKVGEISLNNSLGDNMSLNGIWNYKVIAEVYNQFNEKEQTWPYYSFYLYEDPSINFSKRPQVQSYTQNSKSALFNGMIHPIIPYNIKGSIWYQGENNVSRFKEYETLFPAMIKDWRKKWGSDFPFYFVQIAPFENYNGLSPSLRNIQRKTLKVEKTGMVVTLDIGEIDDIHPSNKHDVGYRLAGLALSNDYGKPMVASGPLYENFEVSGNKLIVTFDFVGSGLTSYDKELAAFEIAGADKKYVKAKAYIENNKIYIYSSKIQNPKYARYAWKDTSVASLFNKEGLPASTFTTE
ncbi:sialate O-acetylesterase [Flavobacteriaceae bacterium]|nr:sialate O-acetylesterase [Flavobacteriaceae bacterium]